MKGIHKKHSADTIRDAKSLSDFLESGIPSKIRNEARMTSLSLLFNIILEVLTSMIGKEKEIKC